MSEPNGEREPAAEILSNAKELKSPRPPLRAISFHRRDRRDRRELHFPRIHADARGSPPSYFCLLPSYFPMLRPADHKIPGEQAECMFIYRAMQHGLIVSKPYGDSAAYDFIVQPRRSTRRLRAPISCVQVKSTAVKTATGLYCVNARRHSRAYRRTEIDFIAAWVIPEDAWYIIPISAIRGAKALTLFPHRPSPARYEPYREAWHLLM